MRKIVTSILCAVCCVVCHAQTRIAVIPIEFKDLKFTEEESSLQTFCRQVEDYFNASLHGDITFKVSLLDIYSAGKNFAYYGGNTADAKDALFHEAVYDACTALNKSVDFSKFDHIVFITAGSSEADGAGDDYFWPEQRVLPSNIILVLDGKKIERYGICTEKGPDGKLSGHGDICHETGHLLGLPDLYDTDNEKSGGISYGLWGNMLLMDKGNKNGAGHNPPLLSAVELDCLGKGHARKIEKGTASLGTIDSTGEFLVMKDSEYGRYYLAENRAGYGLLVYAIDKSERDAGWSDYYKRILSAAERWKLNEVNCNPAYQCAMIVNGEPLPSGNNDSFDFGNGIALTGISRAEGGAISFNALSPLSTSEEGVLQYSGNIRWESDFPTTEISSCQLEIDNRMIEKSSDDGVFAVKGLSPNTEYAYTVTLTTVGENVFVRKSKVKTLPLYDNVVPFIYMMNARKHQDGRFIRGTAASLHVFNSETNDCVWKFNGRVLGISETDDFHLDNDGILEVGVQRKDGSTDIIMKKINVR